MRSHYFEQVNFFLVFSCNLFKFSSVFYPFLLLFSWQFQFWSSYIWLTVVFLKTMKAILLITVSNLKAEWRSSFIEVKRQTKDRKTSSIRKSITTLAWLPKKAKNKTKLDNRMEWLSLSLNCRSFTSLAKVNNREEVELV